jgi:dihydroorotase
MVEQARTTVLRGAHVVDPAQAIDRVTDVVVRDGRIAAVGGEVPADAEVIDLTGHHLSPGWIDIHIHAYGMLGFANPDTIGIWQGVTSYVDAGGPGIDVMDEFAALLEGHTVTDLYAGPYIRPMGIIGSQFIEGDIRSLMNMPITPYLDFMTDHPGLIRYLKIAALGNYGTGPLKMGKGLAEIIGVPLYGHIGEFQLQPDDPSAYEIFNISQAGDIITHLYHANGPGVLDADGRVLPLIRDAERRGILFDIGFGSFNFSWDVATACFEQDLRPHIISSDLQQFGVIGPVFSLAHIMGIFRHLGMTVGEVVDAVTWAPAKALSMTDRAGSLEPGLPADITVFRMEAGINEVADTYENFRPIEGRIVPVMAFKNGVRYDCDTTLCQDEKNWVLMFAEDHVPDGVRGLTRAQIDFLAVLAAELEGWSWSYSLEDLDLAKATALQHMFHRLVARSGISLRDALLATFACFLDSPFTMQIGLFLLQIERGFALRRLREVTDGRQIAA